MLSVSKILTLVLGLLVSVVASTLGEKCKSYDCNEPAIWDGFCVRCWRNSDYSLCPLCYVGRRSYPNWDSCNDCWSKTEEALCPRCNAVHRRSRFDGVCNNCIAEVRQTCDKCGKVYEPEPIYCTLPDEVLQENHLCGSCMIELFYGKTQKAREINHDLFDMGK